MVETIQPDDVFDDGEPYEPAVCHGDTVYVSGQHPVDHTGSVVGDDIATQTTQALTNVERVLEAAGTTPERICKVTVFLTDMSVFPAFNEAYAEWMPEPRPARSAVGVTDLAVDSLVEIEAVAVR
jgi:reactive intermediate/imine deaminase